MSNPYPQQTIFTGKTVTYADTTDEWVLANKPRYLLLTSDKATIGHADPPIDIATITVQLQSPIMTDGERDNVAAALVDVPILCDGEPIVVTLNASGVGTFTVGAIETGILTIRSDINKTLGSNVLGIEVI